MRLVYYANLSDKDTSRIDQEQLRCRENVSRSTLNILFVLLMASKYHRMSDLVLEISSVLDTMAFEYALQLFDESNACLLFLKILANNFPNTAQNVNQSSGSVQGPKSKEKLGNVEFLKKKADENW